MEDLLKEYLPILIFLGLLIILGVAFIGASFFAAEQKPDDEKL